MARPHSATPSLRHHKPSKQAVVTVRVASGGVRDIYLGRYGSAAARNEYNRILAILDANGGFYPASTHDLTISELILAYVRHAMVYYRGPDGKPTPTVDALKNVLRTLKRMCGASIAVDFGPRALKTLRDSWIAAGLSRKGVNGRMSVVKRMFKWAVGEELLEATVFQRLQCVDGLRAGRTTAPDHPPVRPAVWDDVEKALPFMPQQVRALVQVQVQCGARAGELVKMRVCDIDRTNPEAWMFEPSEHKTLWKGKRRSIYFGKRSQDILAPLLLKAGDQDAFVFSPRRSEDDRNADRSANRETPLWPSHSARNEGKRVGKNRKRAPGDRYTTGTYRRAIERACKKAEVPTFTPHRLRHLAATRTREHLGIDYARALLGHTMASVTEVYSHEVDKQLVLKAMEKFG